MDDRNFMSKETKRTILIIAAVLILLAVLWLIFRSSNTELWTIAKKINQYGYNFIPDDLFLAYDNRDISIKEALDGVSMDDAQKASREAGFPSDIDKVGGVTLILANDNGNIITVYLLDGEMELCFVQAENGEIKSLNAHD